VRAVREGSVVETRSGWVLRAALHGDGRGEFMQWVYGGR